MIADMYIIYLAQNNVVHFCSILIMILMITNFNDRCGGQRFCFYQALLRFSSPRLQRERDNPSYVGICIRLRITMSGWYVRACAMLKVM